MAKKRLTEAMIRGLRPTDKRQEFGDLGTVGLRLRIYPDGRKIWNVLFRVGNGTHRHNLGPWRAPQDPPHFGEGPDPRLSVARARIAATTYIGEVRDRGRVKKASGKVGDMLLAYVAAKQADGRLRHSEEGIIERHITPLVGNQDVADVTAIAVQDFMAAIRQKALRNACSTDGNRSANRARGILSAAYGWASTDPVWRDCINPLSPNPVIMVKPYEQQTREEYLSKNELVELWQGAEQIRSVTFRYGVRLLLLTAARRSEIATAEWSEFDLTDGIWTKPGAKTKNNRVQRLPLSGWAIELLQGIRDGYSSGSRYLLPSKINRHNEDNPIHPNSITSTFRRLTTRLGWTHHYTVHDLRRTAATHMSEIRVRYEVIEKILHHTPPSVTARYVRSEYIEEQREALNTWADYLRDLTQKEDTTEQ